MRPTVLIFFIFLSISAIMARRQEMFDIRRQEDVDAIHYLLFNEEEEEPARTEDNGDETDTDSEDVIEERQGDSETEQDADSSEEDENENDFYLGKDKLTKWSKKKPNTRVKRSSHNIVLQLPGVIGEARNSISRLDCWKCIMSDEVVNLIVKYTNIYIVKIQNRFQRDRDAKVIDVVEYKAFIGLLYLAGSLRSNRQSLEELWGDDGHGVELFRLVMNLKRFKFLIRCTRFDDVNTRESRKVQDKLAPIREFFDLFVTNCKQSYSVGQDVTVDEKLEGFRGKCSFRQYIPSKPNKYGIKIYALVDAKMFYTNNLEIYAGKQPDGPYNISNKPKDVVTRLTQPLFGTGRNVTCDNWFTSFELVQFLKEKKLSLLGTVRKNKRQLPPEFVNTKSRAVGSNEFCFTKDTILVSYVPKKGRNVILVSSLHNDDEVDKDSGKAQMILDYNATKSGVDVVDKLCSTYNVARNVRRWPMVIFFALLNVAGINSQIIHFANNKLTASKKNTRRIYLKALSKELYMDELQRRSMKTIGMPTELQTKLTKFRPQQEQQATCHDGGRKRCSKCRDTKKVRYSKYCCKICCIEYFCLEHASMMCENCFMSKFTQVENNLDSCE